MSDFYLEDDDVINRLFEEWIKYGKLIIAYDYDDTVYDYHEKGRVYYDIISLLRECKELGADMIVFTCCDESKYDEIKRYLTENDIPFDKINENMEYIPFTGRKIYYNHFLDDRAGLGSAYSCLLTAVYNYKLYKNKIKQED